MCSIYIGVKRFRSIRTKPDADEVSSNFKTITNQLLTLIWWWNWFHLFGYECDPAVFVYSWHDEIIICGSANACVIRQIDWLPIHTLMQEHYCCCYLPLRTTTIYIIYITWKNTKFDSITASFLCISLAHCLFIFENSMIDDELNFSAWHWRVYMWYIT